MKKVDPKKIGLAFTALSHFILGPAGIASVCGVHSATVTTGVLVGFWCGAAGVFITTLYTNGHDGEKPMPPGTSQTTSVVVTKQVDAQPAGVQPPTV